MHVSGQRETDEIGSDVLDHGSDGVCRQVVAVGEFQRLQLVHLARGQVGLQDDVVEVLAVIGGEEFERRSSRQHVDQRLRRKMRGGDVETGNTRRLPVNGSHIRVRDT